MKNFKFFFRFFFGSHVTGRVAEHSDIDIGVKGLPPYRFLSVYARLDNEDSCYYALMPTNKAWKEQYEMNKLSA